MEYKDCETIERKYMLEYLLPVFREHFDNIKYSMSKIGSYDRKDMILKLNNKTYIVEAKCRINVKPYYETKGLLMELTKYKELTKLYPNNDILYISFINNTHFYIHNIKKILQDYTLNELYDRKECPVSSCEPHKGTKMKPVLLLPMDKKYCEKVIIHI